VLLISSQLLKSASDPSKNPKTFNNMRQRWLAEKQGRSLADRAPDPELTGGLFDPSQPVQPINPSTLRKSSKIQADSEQPTSELFVPAHSPVPQLPEAVPVLNYQYSQPTSSRQVCFFWHRNQENNLEPGCVNKYNCSRYHRYEPGADISPAPPSYVSLQPKKASSGPVVCWFWHRKQLDPKNPACSNGDSCPRLHEYREGAQTVPPPGFVHPPGELPSHSTELREDDLSMVIDDDDISHRDKPDMLPPWKEPEAPSVRAPRAAPSQGPTATEQHSDKPDVLPPWKEPNAVAVGSERRPYRATCYFWDLAQKNPSNSCKQGSSCIYIHAYEPGVPVAEPPPGWVDMNASQKLPFVDSSISGRSQGRFPTAPERTASSVDNTLSPNFTSTLKTNQPSGPLRRPPWDPYRPNHAICHFWHERGECTRGNSCIYAHDSDTNLPVAPSPFDQQRIRRDTPCKDWNDGYCSKADCWFHHKPRAVHKSTIPTPAPAQDRPESTVSRKVTSEEAMPFTEEPEAMPPTNGEFGDRYFRDLQPTDLLGSLIQPQRKISGPNTARKDTESPKQGEKVVKPRNSRPSAKPKRKAWSPRDATNAICHFWHMGNCKKSDCDYIHSTDPTLPIAPHPYDDKARTTCPLWAEGRCPASDVECPYLHEKSNFVPSLGPGLGIGSHDGPHDISRPSEAAISQSTPSGPRTKSVRFADEPSSAEQKQNARSDSRETSSFGRGSGSRTVCRFFQTGFCRFGTSCHFLHEEQSRHSQNHSDSNQEMIDAPYEAPTGSNQAPLPFNRMARDDRPSSDAILNRDADIDMLRSEVSQLDVGQAASNAPAQRAPQVLRKKVSLDDYKKQKALANVGERAKNVVFGSDAIHSAFFDFGELELGQEPWKQEFSVTTQFLFNQLCMAQDLKSQQGLLHRRALKHGSLQPADPNNPAMIKFVDHVAEELILRVGGLLSTCDNFAILLYPSKREEWSFLEQSRSIESRLRYTIFKHDFQPGTQHLPAKMEFGEPYRTLLADKIQGMRLKNLLPVFPKDKDPFKFFLMFPSSEKVMAQYFSAWILASHAESQIFDSLSEGAWDFYVQNTDGFGVVLVHESMASSLHQLPSLSRILKHAGIVIWNVSDSTSLYPLFPSTLCAPDPHAGRLRFTRLFPHGCAFLLSPSFIIAEPERSYELLNWFLNKKFVNTTAGTWKLVCCHDFRGYLLDLANSKAKEKEDFEQEHKDKPAKDSMLYQKKLDFSHCETRYKLYKALVTWQLKHTKDDSDSDSDDNDDNENPFVQAPKSIDQDDDEGLINWFAGWAMLKLDTYRKFPIIGTNSGNVSLATRMKEIRVPKAGGTATTTAQINRVPSPATLQKQKALEIATRLSAAGPKHVQSNVTELDTKADDSDVSMDLAESPASGIVSTTNHGIDAHQSSDVLKLIAQTGHGPEDANRLLTKADGDLTHAMQLRKHGDFEASFIKLLKDAGDASSRQLPPLAVGGSDAQRASLVMSPGKMSVNSPSNEGVNASAGENPFKQGRFQTVQEPQPQAQTEETADSNSNSNTNTDSDSDTEPEVEMETKTITKTFKATSVWYRELQAKGLGWEHVSVFGQWEEAKTYLGVR